MAVIVLLFLVISSALPISNGEIRVLITFCCCIVVLLYTIKRVVPVVEYLQNMAIYLSFDRFDVVIKAIGIGFVSQFVSDMALDSNNKTLSNQMIFAGRVAVIAVALPVFLQVFEIIEHLTGLV